MDKIGDMARILVLRNQHVRLKSEMDALGKEIATGIVRDPAKHLAGNISGLLAVDRSLAKLDAYRINTTDAQVVTGTMQAALEDMQARGEKLAQSLLPSELLGSDALLESVSADARTTFDIAVTRLNSEVGGRFLFGGTRTDLPPLADADTMLAQLDDFLDGTIDGASPAPGTITTFAQLDAAIDAWFAPGGGFEGAGYGGPANVGYDGAANDGFMGPMQLGENESAKIEIRADNDVFRDFFKAAALATMASNYDLPENEKVEALRTAGIRMIDAQDQLVQLRSELGALEARIEETAARNEAERTATQIARLDMVGADQFETATQYESIRAQLESIYTITARSQRLSLAEFMR